MVEWVAPWHSEWCRDAEGSAVGLKRLIYLSVRHITYNVARQVDFLYVCALNDDEVAVWQQLNGFCIGGAVPDHLTLEIHSYGLRSHRGQAEQFHPRCGGEPRGRERSRDRWKMQTGSWRCRLRGHRPREGTGGKGVVGVDP